MFSDLLRKVIRRENLSKDEAAEVLDEILSGNVSDIQMAGMLTALSTKGETFEELAGAASAMRSKATRIQVTGNPVIDIVGTGGDELHTFNISTTSAFVVAGCGVIVAKHGNRSVSSKCGSADVLESLGVNLDLNPEIVEEAVNEIGIGFLFAPKYHGAMKYAMPVRKGLGVRSIFNLLGPLTNPAGASAILLGVYAPEHTEMFANALKLLGAKRALVVYGHDSMDEITVTDNTRVTELNNGEIKTYEILPEQYFGELSDLEELTGGDAAENAEILRGILEGRIKGGKRNIILLNSAAALLAAGKVGSLKDGIEMAANSIDSGAAKAKLDTLVKFTQEN